MLMGRGVIAFDLAELHALPLAPVSKGCDFCASDPPAWRYPARAVGLGTLLYADQMVRPISVGEWGACDDCSRLIEAGDWPGLARRTFKSLDIDLTGAGPGTRVRMLAMFHLAHEQFRKARNGPREGVA